MRYCKRLVFLLQQLLLGSCMCSAQWLVTNTQQQIRQLDPWYAFNQPLQLPFQQQQNVIGAVALYPSAEELKPSVPFDEVENRIAAARIEASRFASSYQGNFRLGQPALHAVSVEATAKLPPYAQQQIPVPKLAYDLPNEASTIAPATRFTTPEAPYVGRVYVSEAPRVISGQEPTPLPTSGKPSRPRATTTTTTPEPATPDLDIGSQQIHTDAGNDLATNDDSSTVVVEQMNSNSRDTEQSAEELTLAAKPTEAEDLNSHNILQSTMPRDIGNEQEPDQLTQPGQLQRLKFGQRLVRRKPQPSLERLSNPPTVQRKGSRTRMNKAHLS